MCIRDSFCTADIFALEIMQYFRERGKKVQRDYGIMGFDNIDILRYISPKLCTIYNAVEEVARNAVDLLFALMDEEEVPAERIVDYIPVDGETL